MLPTPPEGLRHWRPEDADALAAAWADPEIVRWNRPPTDLDPAAWIAGAEQRWARRLALDLVIAPPGTPGERADPVAGEVGLSGFTGLDRTAPARAELGIWVAAVRRRRGLAGRALRDVTGWALSELGLDQVWARTDPANEGGEALFAHLGWDRLGEVDGKTIWSATSAVLR